MHVHTKWIPECNSLPFKHPHLMGESGDEWRLAEELLLGDRPEVSAGQVLGWSASLQVVLSVQPPQPQQLTVTVEGVPTERQRKRRGGHDPRRGQDLLVRNNDVFFFKLTLTKRYLPKNAYFTLPSTFNQFPPEQTDWEYGRSLAAFPTHRQRMGSEIKNCGLLLPRIG